MTKTAIVFVVAICAAGCGILTPGGTKPIPDGGTCIVPNQFMTVGQIGYVVYEEQQQQLLSASVTVADYALDCTGTNAPPDYGAQNYWHNLGFEISGSAAVPFTVTYPGPQSGDAPSFEHCSYGAGVGGNAPSGLACGGSYLCQSGTVTIMSAGPNSVAGTYALEVSNGIDAAIPLSGSFDVTAGCASP